MSPGDQGYIVVLTEGVHGLFAEDEPGSSLRGRPAFDLIRIGPHHITHDPFLRYLLNPLYAINFLNILNLWGKTTMDTVNFSIDQGGQVQIIEGIGASSPYVEGTVFTDAFVVEAVDLGY